MTLRFTSGAKTVYRQKNNSTTEGTEKHREPKALIPLGASL
jgi:hypothetical protein